MSTLRTNALEGVDAKNSINMISSAGNVLTHSLQASVSKSWVQFNGSDSTPVPDGAFNTSSITDNSTGNYNHNFTNNMANGDYSSPTSRQWNGVTCPDSWQTSYVNLVTRGANSSSVTDGFVISCAIFGDLA